MNVLSITATNFRSWDLLDVNLPLGATAIVGENGAGKSSIVQALDYCLFAGRGEGARLLKRGAVDMSVVTIVEHAGATYSVARGVRRGKPWLTFEQLAVRDPLRARPHTEVLTLENVEQTSRRIVETLGMTREAFRCSSVLMQGDAAAWTEADPIDRKRVLATALRLEEWDRLGVLAKRDRLAAEFVVSEATLDVEQARELRVKIAELERGLLLDVGAADELEREVRCLEGRVAGRRTLLEVALGEQARRIDVAARRMGVEAARQELAQAEAAIAESEGALTRAVAARAHAAGADELGRQLEDARVVVARRLEAQRALATQREQVERFKTVHLSLAERADRELEACPTCGQALAGEAAATAQATLDEAVSIAEQEWLEAQAQLDALLSREPVPVPDVSLDLLENELRTRHASAAIALELESRVRPQADLERELGEASARHAEAVARLAEAPELDAEAPLEGEARRMLAEAEAELDGSRRSLTRVQEARARLEGRREAAQERLAGLEGAEERKADALSRVDVASALEAAYGRDGVPALIVEQRAVPALEAHANQILEEWGSPMRVELRTQRATQAGAIRESLDIVVHGTGGEGEYRDYSGGEKTRLNVALRIALALLLSSSRSADVRTLIVDEPEYLDPAGNDALAEILRGLSAERFDRVLLVSPKADLGDALDQSITVAKDEHGCSSVVA